MPVSPPEPASPLRAAVYAQAGGVAAALALATLLARTAQFELWQFPLVLALLQGLAAALIALWQNARRWWLPIHLVFVPLAVVVQGFDIAPGWFLGAFLLSLLVFWRTDRSQVPLYLSNRPTTAALVALLPAAPVRVIDLGCGDGGLLRHLAAARPDCRFVGIEHAPLPWLLARLRARGLGNLTVRRGDFWQEPLNGYDFVYAFLSPAPMPRLWRKAASEMAPGALLISNSFAVPDVVPSRVIEVEDRRATRLYLYTPKPLPDR